MNIIIVTSILLVNNLLIYVTFNFWKLIELFLLLIKITPIKFLGLFYKSIVQYITEGFKKRLEVLNYDVIL